MSDRVFRVQDRRGRGPFAPGASRLWADPEFTRGMLALPTWLDEFGLDLIDKHGRPGEVFGCATRTIDGLCRWFSKTERPRLSALGFNIVAILPGRILAESSNQLVFARFAPLNRGARIVPWSAAQEQAA